jgi:diguanylate cyclase (GGDEF)-like protein/PAS domain S-box-containing protein
MRSPSSPYLQLVDGATPGGGAASPALLLARVWDAIPHMLCVLQADGTLQHLNAAWHRFTADMGLEPEAANAHWLLHLHYSEQAPAQAAWLQSLHSGEPFEGEYRMLHRDGSYRWVLLVARPQEGDGEAPALWFLTATDIHERVLAREALRASVGMQREMLDVSVDCIKILHPDGRLAHMNKAGCEALGVSPQSGFGQVWLELLPTEVHAIGAQALAAAQRGEVGRFPGMSVIAGAATQYWDNMLTPVLDGDGTVTSILCVSRNVTQQREAEMRLRTISETDELTHLPNRRAFNAQLTQALQAANAESRMVGVMLIDLDHFKHVNDTLGHAAGDFLLQEIGARLHQSLAPHGLVARLGGDEFAVLVPHALNEEHVRQLALQAQAQSRGAVRFGTHTIHIGMTMGCAVSPRDASQGSLLMNCADTALHDLKDSGRGGVRMFRPHMHAYTARIAAELSQARSVLQGQAIQAHYQVQMHLHTNQVTGFEALMRWRDADGAWQLPQGVQACFKDYELATSIGEYMRNQVFADMVQWQREGYQLVPVAVNASPVEFLRDDFAERFLATAESYGVPLNMVEVEITEHMLGDRGAEHVVRALRLLKQHGVRIALDDFGTGHSSLTHLNDYPVDRIKIDCEFVRRMDSAPRLLAIIGAVAQLSPSLSLDVVAEGIETERQRQTLWRAGCSMGQGFLFGHAVDAQSVRPLLMQRAA